MSTPKLKPTREGAWQVWDDEEDGRADQDFKPLSREQAQALRESYVPVSPWRVIVAQVLAGLVMTVAAWLWSGRAADGWSVLYGSLCVVVPATLMARGMTSRLSRLNPGVAAVSFMMWEFGKIAVSVLMLALAPKIVHDLSWPLLLLALVVCIKMYWVALRWRGSKKR